MNNNMIIDQLYNNLKGKNEDKSNKHKLFFDFKDPTS
jgi:hypothetical protein